jgi:hypothetical protein
MAELNELFVGLDEAAINTINNNIKVSGAKFKDISTGKYVDVDKYNKLSKEYDDYKATSQTDLETKLKEATDNNTKLMSEQVSKFKGIIKNRAIDNFVGGLGVKDEFAIAGIKAKLGSDEGITVDDEFNLVGYEDAFKSISDSYKVQETTKVVGTKDSNIVKNASTGTQNYELKDVIGMSEDTYEANKASILKSIKNSL